MTPNHALQRTAPHVTAPAPRRPTAQEPRRAPRSLSLGSLGVLAPLSRERCHEDSQRERFLIPSIPRPRLFPVCAELRACSPSHASRSTSAASSAPLPLGFITMPASSTFSSPVHSPFSTGQELWSFVASMRSAIASFLSPVTRMSPANPKVSGLLFHVSTESNRTPNHALQRTAPPSLSLGSLGPSASPPQRPTI